MPKAESESTPPALPPSFDLLHGEWLPTLVREWEQWEGFRFTFLAHFTRREDTDALQRVAQLLYDLVMEKIPEDWPKMPPPATRWEMVAAMSDLQFLEGYLRSVYKEHQLCSLSPEAIELSQFAGVVAHELSQIVERMNEQLAKLR
jgi:hypothetical protein